MGSILEVSAEMFWRLLSFALWALFFLGQEPVSRRSRKIVAPQKPQQNLKLYAWLQRHFIFIQNVSDLYTSKLLDKEKLKIALQVQKDSWALEKWVQALRSESFWKYCGTFVDRGNIYYLLIFSICQFDRHFRWIEKKNTAWPRVITASLEELGRPVEIESFNWHVALNTCVKKILQYSSTNYRKPQAVSSE